MANKMEVGCQMCKNGHTEVSSLMQTEHEYKSSYKKFQVWIYLGVLLQQTQTADSGPPLSQANKPSYKGGVPTAWFRSSAT